MDLWHLQVLLCVASGVLCHVSLECQDGFSLGSGSRRLGVVLFRFGKMMFDVLAAVVFFSEL